MPPSNHSADRLAKSLQVRLSDSVGVRALRNLGWFDTIQDGWPTSAHPHQVACEALFHLTIDSSMTWSGNQLVVIGIV